MDVENNAVVIAELRALARDDGRIPVADRRRDVGSPPPVRRRTEQVSIGPGCELSVVEPPGAHVAERRTAASHADKATTITLIATVAAGERDQGRD